MADRTNTCYESRITDDAMRTEGPDLHLDFSHDHGLIGFQGYCRVDQQLILFGSAFQTAARGRWSYCGV